MNPTQINPELGGVAISGMTRSSFIVRGALTAGAIYGTAAATPWVTRALAQSGDVEIVNFALTLEYLEADFYEQALKKLSLSDDIKRLSREIADNEAEHVTALAATVKDLGGKAVQKPKFDFGDALADEKSFLKLANTLEDTGVSAYNGAGPAIESPDILAAAGSIVQIEARHAALIRLARGVSPAPRGFDKASTTDEVLEAVTPLIVS